MAKYTMQPGDRIMMEGAYFNPETGQHEQKARHLRCADGREMEWGTFQSADRAAATKKRPKKAAKRADKADKAPK